MLAGLVPRPPGSSRCLYRHLRRYQASTNLPGLNDCSTSQAALRMWVVVNLSPSGSLASTQGVVDDEYIEKGIGWHD